MFYPFPLVVVSHYSHYCSLEGQTLPSNCLLASLSKSAGLKQKPSFSCLGFTEPQTWMSDTFFTLISQFSYLVLCSFPSLLFLETVHFSPTIPLLTLCIFVFLWVFQQSLNRHPASIGSINQFSLTPKGPFQNANRATSLHTLNPEIVLPTRI